MAFTDFDAKTWILSEEIEATLMNNLEKRAMGARATCKVYRANSIPGGPHTGGDPDLPYLVDWGAEEWDNDSMWASGGDSDLVTIQQDGIYMINATVATTGSASGNNTYLTIELDSDLAPLGDGQVLGSYNGSQDNGSPAEYFNQVSAIANLDATSTIKLKVMADTNFDIDPNVYGDAGDGCWMSVTMIARTPTDS